MGTLSIVATPIGNLEDITIRAIKTLFTVDIIACEDTRRTGLLLQELSTRYATLFGSKTTKPTLVAFYDDVEGKKTPEIIEALIQGRNVALVSDAGTPLINDPGYLLVHECIKREIRLDCIPGPTAAITALTVSGLPTNHFLFLGYPPEKESQRKKLFTSLKTTELYKNITVIFYCAPHKLELTLKDMQETLGDIDIVLCRELTKIHEETWKGKPSEALKNSKLNKGELVLLFNLH